MKLFIFPGTLPRTEQNLSQDVNKRMIKLAEIDNIETSPKDFIWEVGIPPAGNGLIWHTSHGLT